MQVLGNLLSNALRYVPAGSHVLVRTQPRDQDVVISVLDDGPGVLPDYLSHLFERFWRMDQSRQRASGGSGLRLSIAAEIVEAQGGRIWAKETPGSGLTVRFSLSLSLSLDIGVRAVKVSQNGLLPPLPVARLSFAFPE